MHPAHECLKKRPTHVYKVGRFDELQSSRQPSANLARNANPLIAHPLFGRDLYFPETGFCSGQPPFRYCGIFASSSPICIYQSCGVGRATGLAIPFRDIASEQWQPKQSNCHCNADKWLGANNKRERIRGWLTWGVDSPGACMFVAPFNC